MNDQTDAAGVCGNRMVWCSRLNDLTVPYLHNNNNNNNSNKRGNDSSSYNSSSGASNSTAAPAVPAMAAGLRRIGGHRFHSFNSSGTAVEFTAVSVLAVQQNRRGVCGLYPDRSVKTSAVDVPAVLYAPPRLHNLRHTYAIREGRSLL